ncbi:MAG: GntR family transcriptional regulator [Acidobacteria bacterium]|nr:GntR family transcriptional regulator [Acidobacteriota bacterium]
MPPATMRSRSLIELNPEVSTPVALPDRIYATLKHRILTCVMRPGERIVEKTLCAEMQVSRTPLREALNRLALEGLVLLMPFRGYIAAPLSLDGFRELCEVRRILEAESAALAARRATPEALAKLNSMADLHYSKGDLASYEGYLRANCAFHLALAQATGNTLLTTMVMTSLDQHQRPLYLGLGGGVDAAASAAEHREVVDAVATKNASRARTLMINHITHGEKRIISALAHEGY